MNQPYAAVFVGYFPTQPLISIEGDQLANMRRIGGSLWQADGPVSRTFVAGQQYTLTANGKNCLVTARPFPPKE